MANHILRNLIDLPPANRITSSQIAIIATATPIAMLWHTVNTIIATVAFHDALPVGWVVVWSLLSIGIAYFVLVRRKKTRTHNQANVSPRAVKRSIAFGFLLAAPWGILGFVCLGELSQGSGILLIALLVGMAASGGALLAPVYPAAFAYVAAILLPSAIKCFYLAADVNYLLLAALCISFGMFLIDLIATISRLTLQSSIVRDNLGTALTEVQNATCKIYTALHNFAPVRATHSGLMDTNPTVSGSKINEISQVTTNIVSALETASSELIKRESAVAQGQARLLRIMNHAMDGIICIDSQQKVLLLNASAGRIFKLNAGEAVGQPIARFLPAIKDMRHREMKNTNQLQSNQSVISVESVGNCADGTTFPLEFSLSAPSIPDDEMSVIILRDISDRAEKQKHIEFVMRGT